MTFDSKATTMAKAILDYIYEEGDGKINNAETVGILELVKAQFIVDLMEGKE